MKIHEIKEDDKAKKYYHDSGSDKIKIKTFKVTDGVEKLVSELRVHVSDMPEFIQELL